ncbi:MAG: hypothetical protein WD067_10095 [Gaiellaceae bacterium]
MRGNWDETAPVPHQQLDADTILRTLLAHEVEFVVIGGLAVGAHGFPRATKDVDVVPAPGSENLRRLYAALSELGAEPMEMGDFRPEELPVPFAPEGLDEGGNWTLRTRAGRVDVMQWIPGIDRGYEQLRPNAIEADVPGVGVVLFAGYDDLSTMKRIAGRPEDELDLLRLEDVRRLD